MVVAPVQYTPEDADALLNPSSCRSHRSRRPRGCGCREGLYLLERALVFSDIETQARDRDAELVETHEDLDQALDDATETYEEEQTTRLAAATMASTARRSASAFASV